MQLCIPSKVGGIHRSIPVCTIPISGCSRSSIQSSFSIELEKKTYKKNSIHYIYHYYNCEMARCLSPLKPQDHQAYLDGPWKLAVHGVVDQQVPVMYIPKTNRGFTRWVMKRSESVRIIRNINLLSEKLEVDHDHRQATYFA